MSPGDPVKVTRAHMNDIQSYGTTLVQVHTLAYSADWFGGGRGRRTASSQQPLRPCLTRLLLLLWSRNSCRGCQPFPFKLRHRLEPERDDFVGGELLVQPGERFVVFRSCLEDGINGTAAKRATWGDEPAVKRTSWQYRVVLILCNKPRFDA